MSFLLDTFWRKLKLTCKLTNDNFLPFVILIAIEGCFISRFKSFSLNCVVFKILLNLSAVTGLRTNAFHAMVDYTITAMIISYQTRYLFRVLQ